MQTPGEKHLLQTIQEFLQRKGKDGAKTRILNIGAGKNLAVENYLAAQGIDFISDRVDVIDCTVEAPYVGNCYRFSVEEMTDVQSQMYDLAFANYVLEHIEHPDQAAREIQRILKPGGLFVTTIPNPQAPEFVLSKHSPLWFHGLFRKEEAFETHYAFKSINELCSVFGQEKLQAVDTHFWSFTQGYLERFPVFNWLGAMYDKLMNALRLKFFMNNVCVVLKKVA